MTVLATRTQAESIERVILEGDLSRLSAEQKLSYYMKVCESLGLNPYTKPFDYLRLNGREILYARKDATDQLRKLNHVSIIQLEREQIGDLLVVTATAQSKDGRRDSAIGAVPTQGLKGEALANALMKAETKAKRRVTLSICGLGMTDESEVDSIPGALKVNGPIYTPDELGAVVDGEGVVIEEQAAPAAAVDRATGEVQAAEPERDAAMQEWVLASDEATQLGIEHKQLPDNADTAKIERWTAALHDKIYATREANGGTISSH